MTSQALDTTLSEAGGVTLATRGGLVLKLRPVTADDAATLTALFDRLAPEDMRFRFLSGREHLSAHQLAAMIGVDHRHSEHLLAFDAATSRLTASLMIVADEHMDVAEVAIAVSPDLKGQGIGWTLLKHAAELARERGVRRLRSIESRANHQAIEVERALGFNTSDYEGDATLVLVEAQLG
ncbi:acetyltransferase [Novosphingobium sp. CF614]|uniref:GNAT family N-acetyltransferase n=1 Tax=Novosphingobium sp. CF614 TaxID=1884364 RepID=UPI0008F14126|nr:GNAT family N-acetyltransferase [Novosphingobium sp. CF614]SFG01328.1 acetyltransferase [Novosphingobium sp. CF614]